ncbi:MAG: glycoside hydrolase family 5 protein, partial [Chloroflexi bacterium]|nr:glycoside hydrolase family 5 protein [Chloroflexota bacterium]
PLPTATLPLGQVGGPTRVLDPTPTTAPPTSAPAGGPTRLGVRVNLLITPADRERTLNLAQELGVIWLGQQVVWRDFEGVQGQRDFRFLDDAVHEASARGFKLLLSVTKAPRWAYQGDAIDPGAYADFCAALAARYNNPAQPGPGQVQAIEVYNEPNLAAEWGAPCNAVAYAALLKRAYAAIKGVDRRIVVVSAGLTPTGVYDPYVALDDVAFLQQVKAAGGLAACDAVGVHVSGFNNPPEATVNSRCGENPMYGCHASFYVLRYRELQAIAGQKPLWVTECGYASTRDPAPGYEYAQDNPENALGDYLAATVKLLRGDGAGAVFWWNLNYAPLAPGSEQAAFSLVDQNWAPRAHYHRLKAEVGH